MTNAELIECLRCENENYGDCSLHESDCKYRFGLYCAYRQMMHDAADALEADDKRIAELEDDFRNGTISDPERFKIYGYKAKDLILFAMMCRNNNVREEDMKQAAWNLELAVRAVQNERMEIVKKWSEEMSNGISVRFIPDFEKAIAEMRGEHNED